MVVYRGKYYCFDAEHFFWCGDPVGLKARASVGGGDMEGVVVAERGHIKSELRNCYLLSPGIHLQLLPSGSFPLKDSAWMGHGSQLCHTPVNLMMVGQELEWGTRSVWRSILYGYKGLRSKSPLWMSFKVWIARASINIICNKYDCIIAVGASAVLSIPCHPTPMP